MVVTIAKKSKNVINWYRFVEGVQGGEKGVHCEERLVISSQKIKKLNACLLPSHFMMKLTILHYIHWHKKTPEPILNDIKLQANDAIIQVYLFSIFFKRIVHYISSKNFQKFISDFTYDSLKSSPKFRSLISSLSTAFMCATRASTKKLLDGMQYRTISTVSNSETNSMTIESKIYCLMACVLRTY